MAMEPLRCISVCIWVGFPAARFDFRHLPASFYLLFESAPVYLMENEIYLPMSIELPLHFTRGSDFKIKYDPDNEPPSLSEINKVLRDSKDYILENLSLSPEVENDPGSMPI